MGRGYCTIRKIVPPMTVSGWTSSSTVTASYTTSNPKTYRSNSLSTTGTSFKTTGSNMRASSYMTINTAMGKLYSPLESTFKENSSTTCSMAGLPSTNRMATPLRESGRITYFFNLNTTDTLQYTHSIMHSPIHPCMMLNNSSYFSIFLFFYF